MVHFFIISNEVKLGQILDKHARVDILATKTYLAIGAKAMAIRRIRVRSW